MIGYFGTRRFEVSSRSAIPLQNFQRAVAARFEKSDRIGLKAVTEYMGPGLDTVSFTIKLLAALGVSPRLELDDWAQLASGGQPAVLVVGGKALGVDMWVCTGATESWDTMDSGGGVLTAGIDLTFEEYVNG